MKKMNKKGFLLAESIIVGVFVLSLFTFLFINVVPLVGQYEAKEKYDTITGAYNANLIRTMILEDSNVSSILELNKFPYKKYDRETLCSSDTIEKVNYCTKLLGDSYLNVNTIYVTWYRTAEIKQASRNNDVDFDRAARDYIESLDGYKQPAGSTYDNYKRLIVYYNDGTFANIEVKVSEGGEDDSSGTIGGTTTDDLGCILTAQPSTGTKKGENNWYVSDVNIYIAKTGAVIEYGIAATDTPETPVYNGKDVVRHTEDTSGTYYYGYVKDIDGFEESCSIFIKKDTTSPIVESNPTAPTPEIYNPTGGNPVSEPFSLTVKAQDPESGIDYWYYSYDEENWTKYDDPEYDSYELEEYITSPFSQERNQDVYIKVCNKAGLCGVNSTKINIDKSPPECTITPSGTSKNGFYISDVTFTLSPEEGTIKYLITSSQQNIANLTATAFDNKLTKVMNTDSTGTNYYGYIMDPAGNIGECASPTVKRDTTPPPQPTITNPTSGSWTNTPFSLTVTSEDTNSGNAYWYYSYDTSADDSKNWTIYNNTNYNSYQKTTYETSPFSDERNQLVYIRVCDMVGNCSTSASTNIAIDTTAPTCLLDPDKTLAATGWFNSNSGSPLNLILITDDSGTVSSGVVGYDVSTTNNPTYNNKTTGAGSIAETSGKPYYCFVKDAAGNVGQNSYTVKRDVTAPSSNVSTFTSTARGNYKSYFEAYDSGGSIISDVWFESVSCSDKQNCKVAVCSKTQGATFKLGRSIVADYVSFTDSISKFNYVSATTTLDKSCSSFPCTSTTTHYAYDNAGNALTFNLTWSIDYLGRSGSVCTSGGEGTGG